MKRRIAKPVVKLALRYFTPDLYLRFNATDARMAEEADADWARATAAYAQHLKDLKLPKDVESLSKLSPHDAAVTAISEATNFEGAPGLLIELHHEGKGKALIYSLKGETRTEPAPPKWPFNKVPKLWMYDEVDAGVESGVFFHRILFSDGAILEIPFIKIIGVFPTSNSKSSLHPLA